MGELMITRIALESRARDYAILNATFPEKDQDLAKNLMRKFGAAHLLLNTQFGQIGQAFLQPFVWKWILGCS